MDIRDIESVITVYKTGNYFEAAYQLAVSESTLSRQIHRLEEELGIEIFRRAVKGKPLSLTKEGEMIIDRLDVILTAERDVKNTCKELRSRTKEDFSIGYMPSFVSERREQLISEFTLDNTNCNIIINTDSDKNLTYKLISGNLDCCLLPLFRSEIPEFKTLLPDSSYIWMKAYEFKKLRIGVPSESTLAKLDCFNKENGYLLKDKIFIFNATSSDNYAKSLQTFLGISDLRKRNVGSNDPSVLKVLVRSGNAVIPAYAGRFDIPGLCFVPVEDYQESLAVYLVYSKKNKSKAVQNFSNLVKERYTEI